MVDSACEGGGRGRAAEREVPFVEIGFEGCGVVVGRGLGSELGGFFEDAFCRWRWHSCGGCPSSMSLCV